MVSNAFSKKDEFNNIHKLQSSNSPSVVNGPAKTETLYQKHLIAYKQTSISKGGSVEKKKGLVSIEGALT